MAGLLLSASLLLPMLLAGSVVAAPAVHGITFASTHHKGGGGGTCTGGTVTPTTSSNWAGYAVQTCLNSPASGVVSFVGGTWTEPTVQCTGTATSYSAFWVGIDGYSSRSVEQIGTDSDCASGVPSYYAWYEMYPKMPSNLVIAIHPGDVITATVTYIGSGKFTLAISDATDGASFSTTQMYNKAARSSAEWVTEAPSGGSVLPLANFGTVQFTSCTATLNGVTGAIQDNAWQASQMTMVGSTDTKATTSNLGSNGESFSNTWVNAS